MVDHHDHHHDDHHDHHHDHQNYSDDDHHHYHMKINMGTPGQKSGILVAKEMHGSRSMHMFSNLAVSSGGGIKNPHQPLVYFEKGQEKKHATHKKKRRGEAPPALLKSSPGAKVLELEQMDGKRLKIYFSDFSRSLQQFSSPGQNQRAWTKRPGTRNKER